MSVNGRSLSRRALLGGAGAGGAALLLGASPLLAQASRLIPQRPSARVIVDNDFAGDPDGLIALAHQLLSPKTRVPLVTASALDPKLAGDQRRGRTAESGRQAALELIRLARLTTPPPVIVGGESFGLAPSPAARAIVAEAMRDDPLPLFVTCGGPLTNVAAALRLRPEIATRMTLVWIGGGAYPAGGPEYNLATDLAAARYVIEGSSVPLWQVPQDAYRQLQYSMAEMTADFRPISPLTRWLYERYTELPAWVELGGALTMGDSPLVLLTAVSGDSSRYRLTKARRVGADFRYGEEVPNRSIRVYESLDGRLMIADMLAAFRLAARTGAR